MVAQLGADVSSAQQGAVVDEVARRPAAVAPAGLPGLPHIEVGHQVALAHRKPAAKTRLY